MSALTFLERAKDLDLDFRVLSSLLDRAVADPSVHPKVIARLLRRRAENQLAQRKMWRSPRVPDVSIR